jgi:hypothetical protein
MDNCSGTERASAGRAQCRAIGWSPSSLRSPPSSSPPATFAQPPVPGSYRAITNRTAYQEPAPPPLGPAGTRSSDPRFGSRLLRVTDRNTDTRPGFANASFSTFSAAHQLAWNATSDRFYVRSIGGWYFPFGFHAPSLTATRIPMPTNQGPIETHVEPQFSFRSSNILYAATRDRQPPTGTITRPCISTTSIRAPTRSC